MDFNNDSEFIIFILRVFRWLIVSAGGSGLSLLWNWICENNRYIWFNFTFCGMVHLPVLFRKLLTVPLSVPLALPFAAFVPLAVPLPTIFLYLYPYLSLFLYPYLFLYIFLYLSYNLLVPFLCLTVPTADSYTFSCTLTFIFSCTFTSISFLWLHLYL